MPLILAVEPDRRQAAHVTQVVRHRLGAELILAETTELALTSIGSRVPDLILVPALLSPQDDAALAAALRVIAATTHVQVLTTPLLAVTRPKPASRSMLSAFRRTRPANALDGCDPEEFARQIASYLEAAAEKRATAQALLASSTSPEHDAVPHAVMEAVVPPPEPVVEVDDSPAALEPSDAWPVEFVAGDVSDDVDQTAPQLVTSADAGQDALNRFVEVDRTGEMAAPVEMAVETGAPEEGRALVGDDGSDRVDQSTAQIVTSDDVDEGALDRLVAELDAMLPRVAPVETAVETAAPDEGLTLVGDDGSDKVDQATAQFVTSDDVDEGASARLAAELDRLTAELDALLQQAAPVEMAAETAVETAAPGEGRALVGDDGSDNADQAAAQMVTSDDVDEGALDRLAAELDARLQRVPLGASRSWQALEGMVAEAQDAPRPAQTVERSEWVQLVESLREDVERRAERLQSVQAATVRSTPSRPTENEWGLFDPEQCGFAALLAKLKEITETDDGPQPHRSDAHVNSRSSGPLADGVQLQRPPA